MSWEFVLAMASFGVLMVGWAVLPVKEQHSKETHTQPIPAATQRLPYE